MRLLPVVTCQAASKVLRCLRLVSGIVPINMQIHNLQRLPESASKGRVKVRKQSRAAFTVRQSQRVAPAYIRIAATQRGYYTPVGNGKSQRENSTKEPTQREQYNKSKETYPYESQLGGTKVLTL
jgi:hypothetical protein